jgi:dTDP-4-dehydrorhamnose 3,5-epimerase
MKISQTNFEGLLILEPKVNRDTRGHFMEAFNDRLLKQNGILMTFVQDNQSFSKKGVIRGLHFQTLPYAQTKLVRALTGIILDVVVDLRKFQPTFGKVFSIELSADNGKQLLIPKGFAHGFSVLSESADVLYKIDEYYHPEAEAGIFCKDPQLGVDWKVPSGTELISEKDILLPPYKDAVVFFE